MTNLTKTKQTFYEFRNKVDLRNRETFGYFPSVDGEAMNNELYVFLNKELYEGGNKNGNLNVVKYLSESITNHNIGKDINKDYIQYLLKDRRVGTETYQPYQPHIFYDTSLFANGIQPTLTDYLEYRGDIFELFERTNQLTGPKTDREQAVKDKHIEWYDVDYLKEKVGITRVSKYIFNPLKYSNQWDTEYNTGTHIISRPNEYYRITTTNEAITNESTEKEISLYLTSNSNSLRPPRIYYKKITTQTAADKYEHKFIYPYYLGGTLQLNNSGMNVIEDIDNIVIDKTKGNTKEIPLD